MCVSGGFSQSQSHVIQLCVYNYSNSAHRHGSSHWDACKTLRRTILHRRRTRPSRNLYCDHVIPRDTIIMFICDWLCKNQPCTHKNLISFYWLNFYLHSTGTHTHRIMCPNLKVCFSGGWFHGHVNSWLRVWRLWGAPIGRHRPTIAPMVGMTSPWLTGVIIGVLWCHTTSKY